METIHNKSFTCGAAGAAHDFFLLPSFGISPCGWTNQAVMEPPTLGAALLCIPMLGFWSSTMSIHKQYDECFVRPRPLRTIFELTL